MKNYWLLLIGLVFLSFVKCSDEENCITGSGSLQTTSFPVSPFNSFSYFGAANIEIVQSSNYGVEIEAQQNIIDALTLTEQNGEVILSLNPCVQGNAIINITIRTNQLNSIFLSGSGDCESEDLWTGSNLLVRADGAWDVELQGLLYDNIEVRLSGSSNAELSGTAANQNILLEGSNNFRGFDLLGQQVSVRIDGSGSAQVNAQISLEVLINGAGTVAYKGMPTISSDINGAGSVVDAN
jgi:hypothetical protein